MQRGFAVPVSGRWATEPALVREVAQAAEELGYTSLWTFQRLLWPVDAPDDRTAAPYRSVTDPIAVLGFLAAATQRPRLGVAVLNAPYYAPAVLGKQLATLDVLSAGRLTVALGLGWMDQEFAAVGVPRAQRVGRLEEMVAALAAVWADDPVQFAGRYYQVPASSTLPKPVQRPHPPLLLGGGVPAALRRAGRLADGWVSASRADLTAIGESIEAVRAGAREAGRDPDRLQFVVRGVVKVRPQEGAQAPPLTGSLDKIRADLDRLAATGVTETFVDLNFDPEVPGLEPAAALRRAHEVLQALAP